MKYLFYVFVGWMDLTVLRAQPPVVYTVNSGEIVAHVIPASDRFRYEAFMPGTVVYRNGATRALRLNYNLLYGEVQFVGPSGDTLSLDNEQLIQFVTIGTNVFYYTPGLGYLEALTNDQLVKPARRQIIRIMRSNLPYSGYQASSALIAPNMLYGSSAATASVGSTYVGSAALTRYQLYNQRVDGFMQLIKETTYFLVDQNDRIYPAKKNNLFKLFPRHHRSINTFLRTNAISFKNRADLVRLLQFCNQTIQR